MPRPPRVAILVFPGVQLLDVAGPADVFSSASRYQVELVARRPGSVRTSSGLTLRVDRTLAALRPAHVDTLLVAGGETVLEACQDRAVVDWLRTNGKRIRRLGSICTGAFLLAEAGLLDGRRAVTHWGACEALARRYPSVKVEPDPIFIHDGVWTSAGVTAGIDLALALVEADHGREAALRTARALVMFVKRPGGQSQFSAQLAAQIAEREPIRDLQQWIVEHPSEDLTVERLSERAGMSPRHFARVFARDVRMTPADYVEHVRIEAARRRLEDGRDTLDAIAARTGFKDPDRMRRAFVRRLGVSPREYRLRHHQA